MFERYTERARRVIFFARYEASQFGHVRIETEHLLLGLAREDKSFLGRLMGVEDPCPSIRKAVEERSPAREKVSTSIDLPMSDSCKLILGYSQAEAERVHHRHIGTEHLLLGMLKLQDCVGARILDDLGVTWDKLDAQIRRGVVQTLPEVPTESGVIFYLDRIELLLEDGVPKGELLRAYVRLKLLVEKVEKILNDE